MSPQDDLPHDHDPHQEHRDEGEWITNEPPVDDFGDENAADAATVSEGDDHQAEDQSESGIEPKKGFPLLLLLGAVGSLAVVGGLAYWHFGGAADQQPSLLDVAAQNSGQETAPNFNARTAAGPAGGKAVTVATAASSLPPPAAPTTAYSVPAITPDSQNADKTSSLQGSATPSTLQAPVAMPVMQAAAPPVVVPEPATIAKAVPLEPIVPASSVDDARLNTLSGRIDDVQKSLTQTVQQLSQINDRLSSAASASAKPGVDIEQRLDRMEQKLTQLEQRPAAARSKPAMGAVSESMESTVTTKKMRHAAMADSKRVFQHHKPAASQPNSWVLRAATPGEAWVAKNAQTRELRPVHRGDTLEGIGKITAIQQVGATWVVQGTHGTIR